MKSKIESGAKGRAVAGASAGSRRGVASVGREIERKEISSGYAVIVGRKEIDDSGEIVSEYLKTDGSYLKADGIDVAYCPNASCLMDYSTACRKCAEIVRGDDEREVWDFPPPEYPRVVYVRLSASVMGVA